MTQTDDIGDLAHDEAIEGILKLDGILNDAQLLSLLNLTTKTVQTLILHALAVTKRTENRLDARRADLERRMEDRYLQLERDLKKQIADLEKRVSELEGVIHAMRKTFTIGKAIWAPALVIAGFILGVRLT